MLSRTCDLTPFSPAAVPAGWRVEACLQVTGQTVRLRYTFPRVGVCLPEPLAHGVRERADGLWQHTCAELFVGAATGMGYREFNFSPAGQWAAYDFSGYRQRCEALPALCPPAIGLHHGERVSMEVTLECAALPAFDAGAGARRFGLAMVLESLDGALSYWALAHPGVRPDFHDHAGFVLAF